MKLYLVRHGEAVSKEVDPEQPLSETGRDEVSSVATRLAEAGVRASVLLHSGKKRAEQTAELLAAWVGIGARLVKISGIDPLDPTEEFARTVGEWAADTMVVGHLPFMGKLVSRLLVGDEAASTVAFSPATVVCLERAEGGNWAIAWMIRPELAADRG